MKTETVNCTNYFNEIGRERLRAALEAGKAVCLYIDCIGRTQTEITEADYIEWLRAEYGERLQPVKDFAPAFVLKK